MAFGWMGPTCSFGSQVRNAKRSGSPSTGRQMPANAKSGWSVTSNHILRFLPVVGSGSAVHSEGWPPKRMWQHHFETHRPAVATASFPMCYGPEFVAKQLRAWIAAVGARTAYIVPGSAWENGD